jgi:hypothetical protein
MYRAVDGSTGPTGVRSARDEAATGPERPPGPRASPHDVTVPAGGGRRRGETGGGPRRAWNPAGGPPVDPRQRPPGRAELLPDGSVDWKLSAPSEGPCRSDPGGAGGAPDGRTVPIRKVVWD